MRFAATLFLTAGLFAQTPEGSRCSALLKLRISDLQVNSASAQPATQTAPAHCLLQGEIDKRIGVGGVAFSIGFELRLPVNWQGRFLFQGGGGMDGTVRPAMGVTSGTGAVSGLARGFAVASTDAGHKGAPPNPSADPSFSRDQQARIDNAYRSIERVTTVARAIVAEYYGNAWKYSYFAGCSNGGRQALIAAQRFPTYFDGVLAVAPAFRVTRAAIGSAWEAIALTAIAPKGDDGKPVLSRAFSDAELHLVADAVLQECDAKDGLKDGMIFHSKGCRFDPALLQCPGAKTDACLSGPQVGALHKVFAGPSNSKGEQIYSDWPYDPGLSAPGWRMLKLGTSQTSTPNSADATLMLSGLKGYFMTPYNPNFDPMKFNFDRDPAKVMETAALQDAEATELSTFRERGGKMILTHGMADPFFSPYDTERYFNRLDGAAAFAQYYEIPGMNHCGGGPALDNYDALGALVGWVEQAQTPAKITSTGRAFPGRSRPLCPYPAYAKYNGSGPVDDERSFTCTAPR